ncbi:MAG: TRAP transporter large permease [Synergistetes bacterium]|nr:TRAP transporter large permease [Synergistota bacterium]
MTAILMMLSFFFMMVIGIPLFISLLAASFVGFLSLGDLSMLRLMVQQFFSGMDVFSLMAIPFFILAGTLMNSSGLTDRLLEFTQLIVGKVKGALGYVNVVASILFAGVNGSAAADASALGSILIPAMKKEGYDPVYSAGITAGSSLIGPIIPPSIFMILYAAMTNTSVGGLFVAGFIPGLILGGAFLVMNYLYVRNREFERVESETFLERSNLQKIWHCMPALIAPLIIIGGIVTGVVTPTESGALAVAYVAFAGFFLTKELTLKSFMSAIFETARLTSAIFLIMGAAAVVSWILTWDRVPQRFAEFLVSLGVTENPVVLMLVLSGITFIVGMFMEEVATLTLLTPIFVPLAKMAGIDPLHFGIVMTLNVTIALVTPPMGACVYIVSAIGKVPLGDMFRGIWPFVAVAMIVLVIIILFPSLTTTLPKLAGLY